IMSLFDVFQLCTVNYCHWRSESDGEKMFGLDGEEVAYADFNKKEMIDPQPPFIDRITYQEGTYEYAVADQQSDYPPEQGGVWRENTLICHVTGFYPAPVNVSWTKNGQKVTGSSINTPYPNKDGTFKQTSRLQFTPQLGDIYSCAVQHLALTEPLTKIYEVEASARSDPGVGPSVFCGVGLTLGLLGVAAGTFFLVKGNECS
uniref:Ig-like domain-containing protein n=1 Tax=Maylandia zebra TaxID=106582 RepID=A0A3P9DI05_9CICH